MRSFSLEQYLLILCHVNINIFYFDGDKNKFDREFF